MKLQEKKTEERQIFASRLKTERARRGWTQKQFAENLGVNIGLIGVWEVGRSIPRPDTLKRIAELFGVSVSSMTETDRAGPSEIRPQTERQNAAADGMAREMRAFVEWLIDQHRADPARLGWCLHEMRRQFTGADPYSGYHLNEPASSAAVADSLLRGARSAPAPPIPATMRPAANRGPTASVPPPKPEPYPATTDDDPPTPKRES